MTLYLNRLVRLVLLLSVMVGLVACKPNPQDDIALFQLFITENINKKSADPYISSTVKPGDKMYDILVNIQHGRHDSAANKLQALIEENDSDAMVWYAKLIYRSSINNRPKALSLYQTAMEDDNPYAYIMLSPGLISSGCARYFGEKNCTQEHFNKAIELFKPLAAQGDLRAQYFLLKQQQLDQSKDTRVQYIQEVIRFSQAHYYQPLMDYVNTILVHPQGKDKYEAKTPELYQLAIQLLTIAANHNYIPAIIDLAFLVDDKNGQDELLDRAINLGSTKIVRYKLYEEPINSSGRYFYNVVFKHLSGDYKLGNDKPDDKGEIERIEKEVALFMGNIHSSVYIDGFTSRDDWVD
ncbi:sel1 repeat family protein [Vibrio aestuarianus]|uniref:Sel1 repeat family protein n=1 Tax=Vibrio aestuarianus TaxID=28171 RepID=A0A9X4F9X6_9VIBR|nr:sel1 repeat family protein [Vibrio aestuarianus]MDE1236475.1 sel1 repeat family protein [Vibrio aestuarianus]MDE1247375.1 sel1 repeat family protein [Vibrio aestuarianus]MDE1266140.1 sel1 repeat family protein [Vibrio aestuarianus]MDE1298300.1 sel1 repeat family protein [Vibrio aestuarianus]MDE1347756.1 sel1 repeat family protein [Vibrio aestuarianus]